MPCIVVLPANSMNSKCHGRLCRAGADISLVSAASATAIGLQQHLAQVDEMACT